jgi:hypothetical protein
LILRKYFFLILPALFIFTPGAQATYSSSNLEITLIKDVTVLETDYSYEIDSMFLDKYAVQIMDWFSLNISSKAYVFVTVGPEYDGRPARLYHCWALTYDLSLNPPELVNSDRTANRECRPL